MTPQVPRGRPGEVAASTDPTEASLTQAADIADAYVVLVHSPDDDRASRRPFLSLHSATKAMQRAQKRGQRAELILCRLVPVAADLAGRHIDQVVVVGNRRARRRGGAR